MAVLEALQQIFDAAATLAPPNSNPVFFFGTFLLAFAILFVALSKVPMFQDNKWKPAQLLIAIIIAYFAASSAFTTVLLAELFPNFAIVIVAILVFLILAGMVGFDLPFTNNKVLIVVFLIAIGWLFLTTGMQFIDLSGTGINVFEDWGIIDWVLVGGILLALVYLLPGAREKIGL
jgi:hypothetical protein